MLDLDSPFTEKIFEASGYTGRLKHGCEQFILVPYHERQVIFDEMRKECINFKLFIDNEYNDYDGELKRTIDRVAVEIDRMARKKDFSKNPLRRLYRTVTNKFVRDIGINKYHRRQCSVCGKVLNIIKTGLSEKRTFARCGNCGDKLYELLNKLEHDTGVWMI